MKKLTLTVLLGLILPISSYAETVIKKETPLLPEVKQLLTLPPIDEKEMDKNAYVYLVGINLADDNYFELAKAFLLEESNWMRQAIKDPAHYKTSGLTSIEKAHQPIRETYEHYLSPCYNISNTRCIEEILALSPQLHQLIKDNEKTLTRYNQIILLPIYDPYYKETYDGYIKYSLLYKLLPYLRNFQAIEAINKGDITSGMALLQQDVNFAKKMYLSNNSFSGNIIARHTLFRLYHTISSLLDRPELANQLNHVALEEMLIPLPDQDKFKFDVMIITNRLGEQFVWEFILGRNKVKNMDMLYYHFDPLKQLAKEEKIPLTFELNKTLNGLYQVYMPIIKLVKQANATSMIADFNQAREERNKLCHIDSPSFKKDFMAAYDKDNVIGDYLICATDPVGNSAYIYGYYDLQNYLALIRLKLAIKQQGITKEHIPAFLAKQGKAAINPYTQTPFVWSEEDSTLSTNWLGSQIGDDLSKLSIVITFWR